MILPCQIFQPDTIFVNICFFPPCVYTQDHSQEPQLCIKLISQIFPTIKLSQIKIDLQSFILHYVPSVFSLCCSWITCTLSLKYPSVISLPVIICGWPVLSWGKTDETDECNGSISDATSLVASALDSKIKVICKTINMHFPNQKNFHSHS